MRTSLHSHDVLGALSVLLQLRYAFAEVLFSTVGAANITIEDPAHYPTAYTPEESLPTETTTRTIYSIVFPSPDASPVEITAQSQVLTSYVPEMTWCVGPAIALLPMSGPPYSNGSTTYTRVMEGTGSCETVFAPVQTTVCATTLTGLASKVTITDCDQEVTFSTECGFTLETPTPVTTNNSLITPAPTVKRMFTYWLAPWQSLTAGDTPSDVDVKICTALDDGNLECERYQEVWEVVVVTQTITTQRTVELSTTVSGPGTLIVATLQATINDLVESVSLSTILQLETEIETESISTGRKPTATIRTTKETTSTVFVTKHLMHVPTSTSEPTTTVWLTSTTTESVQGTVTMTRPRPRRRMVDLVPANI